MNALQLHLNDLKLSFNNEPYPSFAKRIDSIERIIDMVTKNEENLCKVVSADFGFRHPVETRLAEIAAIKQAAKYTINHLQDWMNEIPVHTPFHLKPSIATIMPQPKGVVGIVSPWNYPIQLALVPAIAAIAAGNKVWLKLSEKSPRTSGYLAALIGEYFHPFELSVTLGDAQISTQFCSLPFDHLFFTGSTHIGRQVMHAAADNLTPVTLELGGKSPAIIHDDANIEDAAQRIIYGKLLNGGQTCIAPDYILVNQKNINLCIEALKRAAKKMYGTPGNMTGPINEQQKNRWNDLINDAINRGAKATPLLEENSNIFKPTVLTNIPPESRVLKEEIFGPILPIIGIQSNRDVIEYIQKQDRPLALYWFGKDKRIIQEILEHTHSGGVTINDTLLHITVDGMPFGGIGASGMGAYHGKTGFDTFSHLKPILKTKGFLGIRNLSGTYLAHPPYGKVVEKLIRYLSK